MKGLIIDFDKVESINIHRPVKKVGEENGWVKYDHLPITNIEIIHKSNNRGNYSSN